MSESVTTDRSRDGSPRFTLVAAGITLVGCLLAAASPFLGDSTSAFRGSMVSVGVVGLVFAARLLWVIRDTGHVRLAPALVTTVFGFGFIVTPLAYPGVGFAPTAAAQFAGVLTAAFGGYATVEALESTVAPLRSETRP